MAAKTVQEQIEEHLLRCGQLALIPQIRSFTRSQQMRLLEQLNTLPLSVLHETDRGQPRGVLSPFPHEHISEIGNRNENDTRLGLQALRSGKVGAVLLAGGQGSRLGFRHPKGMFNIGVTRKLYIFECLMRNLCDAAEQCGTWIPLFIMTSSDNRAETQQFFQEQHFFGYQPDYIHFFEQEQLPVTGQDGRFLLSADRLILTAPNGNGGWYESMAHSGMLRTVKESGIEWLNVFAVDNVLQRAADPCFIGAVIASGMVSGAKVVAKAAPDEKVGVLCLEDGRPSIVEYFEMTDELRNRLDADGLPAYRYGVILNYLFRVDQLDKTLAVRLPLYRVHKKIRYRDLAGHEINPDVPNAFKYETLALDVVRLQESCLAYEVDREKEFAPVKNAVGVDSVETARALLRLNGISL